MLPSAPATKPALAPASLRWVGASCFIAQNMVMSNGSEIKAMLNGQLFQVLPQMRSPRCTVSAMPSVTALAIHTASTGAISAIQIRFKRAPGRPSRLLANPPANARQPANTSFNQNNHACMACSKSWRTPNSSAITKKAPTTPPTKAKTKWRLTVGVGTVVAPVARNEMRSSVFMQCSYFVGQCLESPVDSNLDGGFRHASELSGFDDGKAFEFDVHNG